MTSLPASSGPLPFRRLALLLVLALSALLVPHASAADPYAQVGARPLAPGVRHEVWRIGVSTALVHVAAVAPGARARLAVVQAEGGVADGRETASAICRRTRGCVAAVNGDYFTPSGPVGGVVVGGTMLRSPTPSHEQLSVSPLRATTPGFGWTGTVALDGQKLRLTGLNVPMPADGLVLYTPAYGEQTPACSCVELVLVGPGAGDAGRLGAPVALTVRDSAAGGTPLSGQVVLAGAGPVAERLRALAAGTAMTVTVAVGQPTAANLGAHPILLRDRKVAPYDQSDQMLSTPQPRTAVAWDARGRLWLVTVDGRQPDGPGLTAAETVRLLRRLGAESAVLEDGGGSTTFVANGRVANSPSDGTERAVSNALVLVVDAAPVAVRRAVAPPRAKVSASMRGRQLVPAPVVTKPRAPRPKALAPVRAAPRKPAPSTVAAMPVVPPRVVPIVIASPPLAAPRAVPPEPAPFELPAPAAAAMLILVGALWAHLRHGRRRAGTASQAADGRGAAPAYPAPVVSASLGRPRSVGDGDGSA